MVLEQMTLSMRISSKSSQNLVHHFSGLITMPLLRISFNSAEELSEEDLDILCSFSLKIEESLSEETWAKIMYTYHRHNIPLLKVTKAHVEFLAAYHLVAYDCCVNSCICYIGPHKVKTHCPYCQEAHKDGHGHPRKTFTYSPIIPHLKAFFKNLDMIKLMQYHGEFMSDGAVIKDLFDSENYQRLKKEHVTIGGIPQPHKFFSDQWDITLGLSLDGFYPFEQ